MTADPFQLFRAFEKGVRDLAATATGTPASAGSEGTSASGADAIATQERLLRMHLACMKSGFRYMQRWAEISATHYPRMIEPFLRPQVDPDKRGVELGQATDAARAFLREMFELPLDESKRLQQEFDALMSTRGGASEPAAGDAPATGGAARKSGQGHTRQGRVVE